MAYTEILPKWLAVGSEPPEDKKTNGWGVGEKPPADWFNYQWNRTYWVLKELQEKSALASDLEAHANASSLSIHGSTTAATPSRLIHRDPAGRAQVAAPASPSDIATKKTVDDSRSLAEQNAQTMANNARDAAILASIGKEQKGANSGVAELNERGLVKGGGLSLGGGKLEENIFNFTFAHTVANQKIDLLHTGQIAGFVEVTVTGTWVNSQSIGKLTKRFNVMTDSVGTPNYQLDIFTEVSGPIQDRVSISPIYWDSATSTWKITIEARDNTGNDYIIHIKHLSPHGFVTWNTGAVYTGAATTLPKAVQVIPDDTTTVSGYQIQKHKLTQDDGTAQIKSNGSMDAITTPGIYFTGPAVTGKPTGYAQGLCEVYRLIPINGVFQRVTDQTSLREFSRFLGSNAVWGAWTENENTSRKNVASGYAGLDTSAKVPRANTYSSFAGLGGVTDLDTAYTAGIWTISPGATSSPDGTAYGILENIVSNAEVYNGSSNWIIQVVRLLDARTFSRIKVNQGVWGPWNLEGGEGMFKINGIVDKDYNQYTKPGTYQIYGSVYPNAPAFSAPWGILNVYLGSNGYVLQEAVQTTAPYGKFYRGRTETEWGPWLNVAVQGREAKFDGVDARSVQNFRSPTDAPSTYPGGQSIFLVNNVVGWPAIYGTVVSTRGNTNPGGNAVHQYFYPYSAAAPIKHRYSLYNSDTWGNWVEILDSESGNSFVKRGAPSAGADLNNTTVVGMYTLGASDSYVNGPGLDWCVLNVYINPVGYIVQEATNVGSNPQKRFRTRTEANVWSRWVDVVTTDSAGKIPGVAANRAVAKGVQPSGTSPTIIAGFTTSANCLVSVKTSLFISALRTVSISVTYVDPGGATYTHEILPATQMQPGRWSFISPLFDVKGGTTINVVGQTPSGAGNASISAVVTEEG